MWPALVACLRRVAEREASLPPEGTATPAVTPAVAGEGSALAGGALDTEGPAVGSAAAVGSVNAGGAAPADSVGGVPAASVTVPAAGSTSTLSSAGGVAAAPAPPHPHAYGRPPPPSTLSSETLRSEDGRRWWYVDHMSNAKGRYVKLTEAVPVRVSVYVPASGVGSFVESLSAALTAAAPEVAAHEPGGGGEAAVAGSGGGGYGGAPGVDGRSAGGGGYGGGAGAVRSTIAGGGVRGNGYAGRALPVAVRGVGTDGGGGGGDSGRGGDDGNGVDGGGDGDGGGGVGGGDGDGDFASRELRLEFKRFFFDVEARSAAGDTFLRLSEVTRHGRSKLVLPVSTWKPMRDILDVYIRHAERQGLFE